MRRAMLLLLCVGCVPLKPTTSELTPVATNAWRWQNDDLSIVATRDTQQLAWRFENRTLLPVVLAQNETRLIGPDEASYTLWGQDWAERRDMPSLTIRPGGFTRLVYPVQFQSPARNLALEPGWRLLVVVVWRGKREVHDLSFRLPKEGP